MSYEIAGRERAGVAGNRQEEEQPESKETGVRDVGSVSWRVLQDTVLQARQCPLEEGVGGGGPWALTYIPAIPRRYLYVILS